MTLVHIDNTNSIRGRINAVQVYDQNKQGARYFSYTPDRQEIAEWILLNSRGNVNASSMGMAMSELQWILSYVDSGEELYLGQLLRHLESTFIADCGIRVSVDFLCGCDMNVTTENWSDSTIDEI